MPARLSDDKSKDVPTWTLTGPLPEAVERTPPQDDSAWGKLFAAYERGESERVIKAPKAAAQANAE